MKSVNLIGEKIIFSTFNLIRKLQAIQKCEGGPEELSILQARILMIIAEHKHLRMSDLAKFFVVRTSAMSQQVDILVREGYVERVPSKEDRRIVHVKLSAKGRRMKRKAFRKMKEKFGFILSCIDDDKKTDLLSILEALEKSLDKKVKQTDYK
ncbi:MAG: MarR family transcriptional regulator [Patescibacteria group bacterium]|nr:MarR family transcriptional regulator [Patescibacteria group bacterium]